MGFSYQPAAGGSMGAPDRNAANPQTAVRLLNLRVPRVVGPNAPIPGQLLNATGGGPTDLNMLLKALMASFGGGKQIVGPGGPGIDTGLGTGPMRGPQMGAIAQPPASAPAPPRFVPGTGNGQPTVDTGTAPGGFGREVTPLF